MTNGHQTTAGCVWAADVQFHPPGPAKKKYFILLNDCGPTSHAVAAFTTSNPKRYSNHAGPLCEMVLLGNVAMRVGRKIEWDAKNMRCPNAPEADALIRHAYRKF